MTESRQQATGDVTIVHREGLHTRPVMKFVDLAQQFAASVRVTSMAHASQSVDGKSAMELMLLGATAGTTLRIVAEGPDAEDALAALTQLVKNRFEID